MVVTTPAASVPVEYVVPARVVAMVEPLRREDGRLHDVLSISDRMCKFPIGDPSDAGFGFCGREAASGARYCAAHCAVTFQPQVLKKRKVTGVRSDERAEIQRLMRRAG
jgi:GcrA cell cycle regulator